MDKIYRTFANKNNCTIAGLSMGGRGAIAYAQRHTSFFSLSASLSRCVGYCSSENARKIDIEFDKSLGKPILRFSYKLYRQLPNVLSLCFTNFLRN
ncbi:hypothetical protein [Dysgonomonas sp. Marseille-P4677]|uniref:alpha/beta hydrolase-fold protein n=1 Tax=Dysgonomonas sp. Marseille-P4677 TaxID=2364790 RepID=UPI00351C5B7D